MHTRTHLPTRTHAHPYTHTLTRPHTLAQTCTYECSSARPHPRVGSRARRPDQGHTRQRRTMGPRTHAKSHTLTHTHTHVRPWAHSHVHPHAHTCTHTQTQNNDARALIHNQKGTPTRVYAPRPARQESHTHASAQPPLISTRAPRTCTHTHSRAQACAQARARTYSARAHTAVQSRQCARQTHTHARTFSSAHACAFLCMVVHAHPRAAHSNNASTRAHTHALARAHTQGSTRAVCDERCRRGRGRSAWSATPELPAPTGVVAQPPPHSSNTCPPRHTHIHLHSRM